MKPFRICYIINAFQSPVVEEALLVLANNNFSLFLTDVNIECMNFITLNYVLISSTKVLINPF